MADYLQDNNIKAEYLHSDVKTIDRIDILTKFRKGDFDCIIGVNLLREGLDLPEVELVGIFDADKEGFLRTSTSLIQTIGRAARNTLGYVILYADRETDTLKDVMQESSRRRELQLAYNKKHNITPRTIKKQIKDITEIMDRSRNSAVNLLSEFDMVELKKNPKKFIKEKVSEINHAVENLDFETAAIIRDQLNHLKKEGYIDKIDSYGKGKKK